MEEKKNKKRTLKIAMLFPPSSFLLLSSILLLTNACSHHYVFQDAPPVTQTNDQTPSEIPHKNDFDFVEYAVSSSARYPLVNKLNMRRTPRSQDVNSMDDVPASSWFTPRLGYKEISPKEMLKGPEEVGPPQAPFKIFKAKTKGNSPGFHVEDSRGKKYLIKFDHSDYPALESTANLVVNRLFWAFGYHVPEDYLYALRPEDLSIAENTSVLQDDIDRVLTFAPIEEDGSYRVTASLFIEGEILGPIPQRGTRRGDLHDQIPHQNLRTLRALRVFCAFTGNSGMRSDNSLDVYAGEKGKGHTVHYLLDFGEALGIHGIEKGAVWNGYEHFFSYQDTLINFFSFGIPIKGWEKLEVDPSDPKGSFDSQTFTLKTWREATQFMPIRHAQPEDDYWASKILAALTKNHLETLFEAAQYPDPDYSKTMIEFLWGRRTKIFEYVFSSVSPLEAVSFENHRLKIKDLGKALLHETGLNHYEVRLFDRGNQKMEKPFWIESSEEDLEIHLSPERLQKARGYIRMEVRKKSSARPAEFHIRSSADGNPKLVGVVH